MEQIKSPQLHQWRAPRRVAGVALAAMLVVGGCRQGSHEASQPVDSIVTTVPGGELATVITTGNMPTITNTVPESTTIPTTETTTTPTTQTPTTKRVLVPTTSPTTQLTTTTVNSLTPTPTMNRRLPCGPVSFSVDGPEVFQQAVQSAANQFSAATGKPLRRVSGGALVEFYYQPIDGTEKGSGHTDTVPKTGVVEHGTVIINSNVIPKFLFAVTGSALHEWGHLGGLDHSSDPQSAMFIKDPSSTQSPYVDHYSAADIATLQTISC